MRDRDREAEQAAARATLRAELRALVDAHPHLRGRADLAARFECRECTQAGLFGELGEEGAKPHRLRYKALK